MHAELQLVPGTTAQEQQGQSDSPALPEGGPTRIKAAMPAARFVVAPATSKTVTVEQAM